MRTTTAQKPRAQMHQLVLIAVAPRADALSHQHRLVHVVRRHQEIYRTHVRGRVRRVHRYTERRNQYAVRRQGYRVCSRADVPCGGHGTSVIDDARMSPAHTQVSRMNGMDLRMDRWTLFSPPFA